MKMHIVKKTGLVAALLTVMVAACGCNRTYEPKFDYDGSEFIELGQYKDIEVEVDVDAIVDDLIDQQVATDMESYKSYSDIARGAEFGDQVKITFEGKIAGEKIDGLSNTNYEHIIGEKTISNVIEGFDDALIGMKAGDFKIVTLKVSDDFTEDTQYTGATIVYEITCSAVKAPIYPQITDAWVKENMDLENVAAYRAEVKERIQESIDKVVNTKKSEAVFNKAAANLTIKKEPEALIAEKKESISKGFAYYAQYYGMTVEEYVQNNFNMSLDEYARSSALQQLLIQEVARKEGFTVDEYYYKANLSDFAYKYGGTYDTSTFVSNFGKDYIINNMIIEKASNLIIDTAIIK
ncbi:MAG: FKBP-type peptidyl-prolyl cis-trans isomerase [Lachnospiraceae bacterium]